MNKIDAESTVLGELDFVVTCDCKNSEDMSPCVNEAKFQATLYHSLCGCEKRTRFICSKHLQLYLDFDLAMRKPGAVCGVCKTNKLPTIENITPL